MITLRRRRRLTFNLGNFENYIVEAEVSMDFDIDPNDSMALAVASTQLNDALNISLFEELQLVEVLTGNRDSAIFDHPLLKTNEVKV